MVKEWFVSCMAWENHGTEKYNFSVKHNAKITKLIEIECLQNEEEEKTKWKLLNTSK